MTIPAERSSVRTAQADLDEVVLDLLPPQGSWTEEQYLWLSGLEPRLIEFTDGFIEVLPVPTEEHQTIVQRVFLALLAVVRARGGIIHFAPLRVRIRAGAFREPDIVVLLSRDDPRRQNRYWLGADLVAEVVSPEKPARDLVEKRADYAAAGIPEYWIVDREAGTIAVLRLDGDTYTEHGVFGRGQPATSALLAGCSVDVAAVLDAT